MKKKNNPIKIEIYTTVVFTDIDSDSQKVESFFNEIIKLSNENFYIYRVEQTIENQEYLKYIKTDWKEKSIFQEVWLKFETNMESLEIKETNDVAENLASTWIKSARINQRINELYSFVCDIVTSVNITTPGGIGLKRCAIFNNMEFFRVIDFFYFSNQLQKFLYGMESNNKKISISEAFNWLKKIPRDNHYSVNAVGRSIALLNKVVFSDIDIPTALLLTVSSIEALFCEEYIFEFMKPAKQKKLIVFKNFDDFIKKPINEYYGYIYLKNENILAFYGKYDIKFLSLKESADEITEFYAFFNEKKNEHNIDQALELSDNELKIIYAVTEDISLAENTLYFFKGNDDELLFSIKQNDQAISETPCNLDDKLNTKILNIIEKNQKSFCFDADEKEKIYQMIGKTFESKTKNIRKKAKKILGSALYSNKEIKKYQSLLLKMYDMRSRFVHADSSEKSNALFYPVLPSPCFFSTNKEVIKEEYSSSLTTALHIIFLTLRYMVSNNIYNI